MPSLTTAKMSRAALRLLRLVAAATGQTQSQVLERLLTAEATRLELPVKEER